MHTKAPLVVVEGDATTMFLDDQFGQEGGRDYYLVEVRHGDPVELKANADRLAACFNACEGLDTVSLRAVAELGGLAARLPVIRGLTRQNAELLAALEDAEGVMRSLGQASPTALAKADEYAKSIAKAKGGAA